MIWAMKKFDEKIGRDLTEQYLLCVNIISFLLTFATFRSLCSSFDCLHCSSLKNCMSLFHRKKEQYVF